MEDTGVLSEGTWNSLNGMYANKEESEFLTQLLNGFSNLNEQSGIWSTDQETSSLVYSSEFCNSSECLVSQETSTFSPDDGQSVLYQTGNYLYSGNDFEGYEQLRVNPRMGGFCDNEMERFDFTPKPVLSLLPAIGKPIWKSYSLEGLSDQHDLYDNEKLDKQEMDLDRLRRGDLANSYAPESKKRSRNVTDISKSKRHMKSEKYQKVVADNVTKNDDSISVITKKSSASESTEEHSSITHEVTKGELPVTKMSKASGGKGKSGKGSSSDPQSLYARKRRERINERLRILQSLVPNGTKVDISTMLEEAVQYVKFLQLQIKLLSSDETWMYAPLAYNGMDIGISNFDITNNSTLSLR